MADDQAQPPGDFLDQSEIDRILAQTADAQVRKGGVVVGMPENATPKVEPYDFRNPDQWKKPFETLYREVLDQIAWAESLGFRSVWLTEHHFCDDGYTPSPLVMR